MHTNQVHQAGSKNTRNLQDKPIPGKLGLWARRLTPEDGVLDADHGRRSGLRVSNAPERHNERTDQMSRRRIAILAGDIAGYSRLVEFDDLGTVAQLRVLRRGQAPLVAEVT